MGTLHETPEGKVGMEVAPWIRIARLAIKDQLHSIEQLVGDDRLERGTGINVKPIGPNSPGIHGIPQHCIEGLGTELAAAPRRQPETTNVAEHIRPRRSPAAVISNARFTSGARSGS